jgi:hypothetical protein
VNSNEIHAVIWPALADDIHDYAARYEYGSCDTMRDAIASAEEALIEAIMEHGVCTPEEVLNFAKDWLRDYE